MPTTIDLPVSANGAKLRSMVGAVIYIRVSTKEQTENLSLPTQLRACEEYCHREGFEIVQRFKEEGESAKTADRTELQRLLAYGRTNKGKVHFVVVFNLTRFARDPPSPFGLRRARQVRPLCTALAPEVARHLSAVSDGTHRRHINRQIDRRRAGRLRAIRQRRSFGQIPRRNAGSASARTMDIPGPARLPECAARYAEKFDAGSRTRGDRSPTVQALCDRHVYETGHSAEGDAVGTDQSPRPAVALASYCSKCLFPNARPEPDFRYRSNRIALGSSGNSITT